MWLSFFDFSLIGPALAQLLTMKSKVIRPTDGEEISKWTTKKKEEKEMQYVTLLKERQMNDTLLPKIEISNAILSPRLSLLELKSNIKRIKANWLGHFLGDLCHSRNRRLPR